MKQNRPQENFHLDEEGSVYSERITKTLQNNYMPYAMSVIVSRAIPEIDGFKPSHRKLLYTMYKMGLLGGKRTKSANVVGQTMKLNPHGDTVIYDTLVRLTRGNAALLHPYIDSKGNFGKHYSSEMAYAAPRYTEVRLDDFAEELFGGIDMDMVDFVPNYDGTLKEPTLLPTSFPAVLVNSNQGIAVGMASNICSFNLGEVCDATIAYLKDSDTDLLSLMPAPDFSGGAELIYDAEKMRRIYETGQGSLSLRARYRIHKKDQIIEIFEIPYSTSIEGIVDELSSLVKEGKVKEIVDVRDETDLNGLRLAIDYRRSSDPEQLMQKLFKLTSLQSTFSCNFNVLVQGSPRVLGVRDILAEWCQYRRECMRRRFLFEQARLSDKLHLLEGLAQILLDIDKAVRLIRETEKESQVVPNLQEGFGISKAQAEYVAEIKLRHLNREHLLKRTAEMKDLKARLKEIADILNRAHLLDQEIIKELQRVKKRFAKERKTLLIQAEHVQELGREDMIDDFNLRIFLTKEGYLKKLALTSLRGNYELKLKDGDELIWGEEGSNKQELLVFTNQRNCYKCRLYDLPENKPSDWGNYLPSVLDMAEGEQVIFAHIAGDYSGELLIAYENGYVSRVSLESFQTLTRRKKITGAFADKAPAVGICYIPKAQASAEALAESSDLAAAQDAAHTDTPGKPLGFAGGCLDFAERLALRRSTVDTQLAQLPQTDFVLVSSQERMMIFDYQLIEPKIARANVGRQVMKMAKKYKVLGFAPLSALELEDPRRYRARHIPASGVTIKESGMSGEQLSLT